MRSVRPWQGVRDGCKQVRRSGVRLVKWCGVRTSKMAALCGRGTMPNGRSIATVGQSVNGDSAEMAGSAPRVPAYGGCGFSVHMPYRIRRRYFRPGCIDRVGGTFAGGGAIATIGRVPCAPNVRRGGTYSWFPPS